MSRYVMKTDDGKELHYGFDMPLQEYFMQVFDDNGDPTENMDTRSEIFQFLDETGYKLPQNHIMALALDVPF